MADTDELVFENDQDMEARLSHADCAELLSSTVDWIDAVDAFKKGAADFIKPTPGSDKWSAFHLRPPYDRYRCAMRKATERLHKGILARSRA